MFWIECAVAEAIEGGLTVEEADAVMGRPMGIPKTGVFGLLDLVGLDLSRHVAREMAAALPKTDAYHAVKRDVPLEPAQLMSAKRRVGGTDRSATADTTGSTNR